MTLAEQPHTPHDEPPLGTPEAGRLLAYAGERPVRPVDALIRRLARDDGADWWERALAGLTGGAEAALAGRATAADLAASKEAAKQALADAPTTDDALAVTARHFVALAALVAHRGERTTSRTREEVDAALVDLAEAVPLRWSRLLLAAAEAPG